jgi:outer membrane protein
MRLYNSQKIMQVVLLKFVFSLKSLIFAVTKPILTMKKVLLTLFAATVVFAASAQISKGTILVNGGSNLGFISANEDAGDFSVFSLDARAGYFVIDNLALGLVLGYEKFDSKVEGAEDSDPTTDIGIFGRYYVNGKILVGASFTSSKQGDLSGTTIGLEAGYAIFVNDAVAIEPALNYAMFGGDLEGAAFGLNVGITVFLGRGE